jgi:predicted MFS family arabinose efflux permease
MTVTQTSDTTKVASDSGRLPRLVYVLAAGTFQMGTTEFMIAGLLPEITAGLDVGIAQAGLLITHSRSA